MFRPQFIDLSRIERMADSVIESVKQLKVSIETTSIRFNAAMLREQTLGIITSESCKSSAQADFRKANVTVILALYENDRSRGCSAPTIIVADNKKQVYAAVVRTRYNQSLGKTEILTVIEGPSCSSDFRALDGLYKLSRAALQRAIIFSKNPNGFDDWDDLDLWV